MSLRLRDLNPIPPKRAVLQETATCQVESSRISVVRMRLSQPDSLAAEGPEYAEVTMACLRPPSISRSFEKEDKPRAPRDRYHIRYSDEV
jgi:hypothetical protein